MSRLRRHLASQLGNPRGIFGRLLVLRLNRRNVNMNARGVEALAVGAGDHALDVGFGGGVGLRALLATPAEHVTGAELSQDMVDRGRRAFSEEMASGRLDLVAGSLPSLPFADGAFDAILTTNTIYFWPDTEAGMRELRRVTSPGGRLAVVIGHRDEMQGPLFETFKTFDEAELEAALRAGGFAQVAATRHGRMVVGLGVAT